MTGYFKALLLLMVFSSCEDKGGNGGGTGGGNGDGKNTFATRDSALASVIQSLPSIFNAGQKQLYGLSDADIKSLSPGADVPVRFISYENILRAQDSSLSSMLTAAPASVLVPLAVNNAPRLFVGLSSEKNAWRIESIGNRRFVRSLPDPANAQRAELVSIPGLEIELIRLSDTVATRGGVFYRPVTTNEQAGLDRNNTYSDAEVMRLLRAYAQVLNRQFGDKLKNGEIDR